VPVDIDALAADLRADTAGLAALVRSAGSGALDRPTPADGSTVRDQLSRLAFYDGVAVTALSDAEAFDPAARVPWFGPDMTPGPKGTARLESS
jgi:hypothetical protein